MKITWRVAPIAIIIRITLIIRFGEITQIDMPIVAHSKVIVKTFTFKGIPLPSI